MVNFAETRRNGVNPFDPLILSSSNNLNMCLCNIMFNGSKFLAWNPSVKMTYGAKLKLGFIDGSIPKPSDNSPNFVKWNRCDCIVRY